MILAVCCEALQSLQSNTLIRHRHSKG